MRNILFKLGNDFIRNYRDNANKGQSMADYGEKAEELVKQTTIELEKEYIKRT